MYTDGSTQMVGSGPQWRTLAADDYFSPESSTGAWAGKACSGVACSGMPQENLDLRKYPTGWTSVGFSASRRDWKAAAVAKPFVLPLANRPARPIQVLERQAKKITPYTDCVGEDASTSCTCTNCYVVDYGREIQGGVNLTLSCDTDACASGHQMTIMLSEELTSDGRPMVPMRTGNNYTTVWTLGAGTHQACMQHEYDEFRYALVVNAPRPLVLEDARAWVLRGMTSDDPDDQYDDEPTLPPSALRRQTAIASFSSDSQGLNSVWGLVRHTLVACGGLDVDVDSNTRQRDFCATDAYVTILGQLALSSDYGVAGMTAVNGFMVDSNIWQGMTDFRSALIAAAHAHALYTGDLSLLRQRYEDIKKHSFVYYYDEGLGLVNKPPAFMGSSGCKCPEAWSPAGLPPGVYEALQCTCTDLNDWPRQYQDGYQICNVSTVANSYIAMAA